MGREVGMFMGDACHNNGDSHSGKSYCDYCLLMMYDVGASTQCLPHTCYTHTVTTTKT